MKSTVVFGLVLTAMICAAIIYMVANSSTVETEWKPGMEAK